MERVEALLPHALASVPPSIKVDTVANRTTTIKASVHDVEFTLALTIALVVMVIFLFLRNAWATIIPGRHRAARAARHRRDDVCLPATASTTSR